MLRITLIAASVLALLAGPSLASGDERGEAGEHEDEGYSRVAHCSVRADADWLPAEQIIRKLKERGYTVRELERSHGCYEVRATDANGVRVKFYADPATAEIVGREGRS